MTMAEQVEVPLLRGLIGRALRRRRLAQQRTLRDVAAAALMSMPYLSEIERGRKEASSEILTAICRALGVRLTDLLDEVRLELARAEPEIAPATPVAPAAPSGGVTEPITASFGVLRPTAMPRPFEPCAAAGSSLAAIGGNPAEIGDNLTGVGGWLAADAAGAWYGDGPVTAAGLASSAHQQGVSPNLGFSAEFEAVLGAGRIIVPAGAWAARRSSHHLAVGAIRAAHRARAGRAGRTCPAMNPPRPTPPVAGRSVRPGSTRVPSAG